MAKNLDFKVNVDVQDNTEASIARLRELRKEIMNVSAGSEDFRRLRTEMDDIEDSLKSARVGAGNFVDILGTVPGPIGEIGSKASDTVNILKQFSMLSVADLKKSFVDLKDDIVNSAKNLANISGITKAYTVLNNFLAASLVKVGVAEGAAAAGATALSAAIISTGIGALVVGLGLAVSALIEFASGEKEAKAATDAFNRSLEESNNKITARTEAMNRENALAIAALKAQGASEAEIRDLQLSQEREKMLTAKANLYEALAQLRKASEIEDENARKEAMDKAMSSYKTHYKNLLDVQNNYKIKRLENISADNAEAQRKADEAQAKAEKLQAERERRAEEARQKREAERKQAAENRKTAINKITEQENEIELNLIEDSYLKQFTAIKQAYDKKVKEIKDQRAKDLSNTKLYNQQLENEEILYNQNIDKIREGFFKEMEDKVRGWREESAITKEESSDIELEKTEEYYDQLIKEAEDYDKRMREIGGEEPIIVYLGITTEDGFEFSEAETPAEKLEKKKQEALKKIRAKYNNEELQEQFSKNQLIVENEMTSFEEKLRINKENQDILNQVYFESEAERTAALKANSDQRKAIEQAEFEFKMSKTLAGIELASQAGAFLQQIAGKNKGLAIAGVIVEQAGAIGKIIANTAIANAKAIAISPLTAGQPFVTINKISAALSIASTIAGAAKAISEINKADSSAGAGSASGSGTAQTTPSKFAQGGLLKGPLHATGGISVGLGEAEGGEFIVNRYATASFLPLLESINNTGRGKTVSQNNLSSDAENAMLYNQQQPIIKTYVVASDITSAQEAQKKISDIARL